MSTKFAYFKAFGEIARAKMGQKRGKIALNHLFEHLQWCRNTFGKSHFGPFLDPQVTSITLPWYVQCGCPTNGLPQRVLIA